MKTTKFSKVLKALIYTFLLLLPLSQLSWAKETATRAKESKKARNRSVPKERRSGNRDALHRILKDRRHGKLVNKIP